MKSATEWSRETDNYRDETCSINFIRECDTKELICLTNVEELSSIKPVATETGSQIFFFHSFLISET